MIINPTISGGGGDSFEVGDILISTRTDLGDEWLLCNGSAFSPVQYPQLAANYPPVFGQLVQIDKSNDFANGGIGLAYDEVNKRWIRYFVDLNSRDKYTGNIEFQNDGEDRIWTRVDAAQIEDALSSSSYAHFYSFYIDNGTIYVCYRYYFYKCDNISQPFERLYYITASDNGYMKKLQKHDGVWACYSSNMGRIYYAVSNDFPSSSSGWSYYDIATEADKLIDFCKINGKWILVLKSGLTIKVYATSNNTPTGMTLVSSTVDDDASNFFPKLIYFKEKYYLISGYSSNSVKDSYMTVLSSGTSINSSFSIISKFIHPAYPVLVPESSYDPTDIKYNGSYIVISSFKGVLYTSNPENGWTFSEFSETSSLDVNANTSAIEVNDSGIWMYTNAAYVFGSSSYEWREAKSPALPDINMNGVNAYIKAE